MAGRNTWAPLCGARTRVGGFCRAHVVVGPTGPRARCRMHGGADGSGQQTVAGRRSISEGTRQRNLAFWNDWKAKGSPPIVRGPSTQTGLFGSQNLHRRQPRMPIRCRQRSQLCRLPSPTESDFNPPSFVRVTRAKRLIFTARLSVEKTSSTFPSKPVLRDRPRRFRDERWPAHIPQR
jgi:hypothetical protein